MTDKLIDRNPDILGGTPVFSGTRVPVRILMEHLEAGDRLDEFLVDESTPRRLASSFPGSFEIHTVQQMGWLDLRARVMSTFRPVAALVEAIKSQGKKERQ